MDGKHILAAASLCYAQPGFEVGGAKLLKTHKWLLERVGEGCYN